MEHVNGPLLVFAGAGSGKTRVITYRIANLVACAHVPPYRILAVTFTNKAAGEMRARLERLLTPEIARDLWAGTFHATCARLLRRHGEAVGLARDFTIYDSSDQKQVVTRALRELDLDEKRYPPRMALARIHKEKQEGRAPDEMNVDGYQDEAWQKVYRKYEAALRAANAVDFEDLVLYVLRILENAGRPEGRQRHPAAALTTCWSTSSRTRTRRRYIACFVSSTREHRNLCVVGDDDQSIYRWRGADVRNIRGFKKDFPDAKVVKLEQNYRSRARIVSAALGVICAVARARARRSSGPRTRRAPHIEVVAVKDEARRGRARRPRDPGGARRGELDPKEIAVFYRVHAQSRVLEEGLRAANLPYQIVGGMKFYERAEVKDALSYLRVLANPKSDVDLGRVINVPARGIGATTIERLTALATSAEADPRVHDALTRLEAAPEIAAAARKRLTGVHELLAKLRAESTRMTRSPTCDPRVGPRAQTGLPRGAPKQENTAWSRTRASRTLGELHPSISDYEDGVRAPRARSPCSRRFTWSGSRCRATSTG